MRHDKRADGGRRDNPSTVAATRRYEFHWLSSLSKRPPYAVAGASVELAMTQVGLPYVLPQWRLTQAGSSATGPPSFSGKVSAISQTHWRGLTMIRSNRTPSPPQTRASASAWRRPSSASGLRRWPWIPCFWFATRRPCRRTEMAWIIGRGQVLAECLASANRNGLKSRSIGQGSQPGDRQAARYVQQSTSGRSRSR